MKSKHLNESKDFANRRLRSPDGQYRTAQGIQRFFLQLAFLGSVCLNVHASYPSKENALSAPKLISNSTQMQHNLFVSGHSLIDKPIPDYLAAIAGSLGIPMDWNRQYMVGSSISNRTRGRPPNATPWLGYRSGMNRTGENLDVIKELENPKTVIGNRYHALLITEQHGLLGSLTWHDTVRHLRHFHDRLIKGNPEATTYFYEPWISLDSKADPSRWIAYEKAASPIWQCVVTRINTSLKGEGRSDRIISIPVGAAFANLVEVALSPNGLPSITLDTRPLTISSLIHDDVHPTKLGGYYAALISFSTIFKKSPVGAWHPADISALQAAALQDQAWKFVSNYLSTNIPLSLQGCSEVLRNSFIGLYWTYVRDTYWKKETNQVTAYYRWAKHMLQWQSKVRSTSYSNPFHYDPATDANFWLLIAFEN